MVLNKRNIIYLSQRLARHVTLQGKTLRPAMPVTEGKVSVRWTQLECNRTFQLPKMKL